VPEDPATGSAIASFGGWLAMKDTKADGEFTQIVHQGIEMGRPSLLEVRATKSAGAVISVKVAGRAVLTGEGRLRLPAR
jgi:trans-2,3-dihydro-3-hydroxyanthranilate isomerase